MFPFLFAFLLSANTSPLSSAWTSLLLYRYRPRMTFVRELAFIWVLSHVTHFDSMQSGLKGGPHDPFLDLISALRHCTLHSEVRMNKLLHHLSRCDQHTYNTFQQSFTRKVLYTYSANQSITLQSSVFHLPYVLLFQQVMICRQA